MILAFVCVVLNTCCVVGYTSKAGKDILIFHNSRASMDRNLPSEQPNVGYLRTYRSISDLAYSYNRAMGIAMIAHRRPCLVGRGPKQLSGHAQLVYVIRPTKRCGNCVTARRLLINSAQTFHHTSRWNLSIFSDSFKTKSDILKSSRHALRKALHYLLEQVVFSRFTFRSLFLVRKMRTRSTILYLP